MEHRRLLKHHAVKDDEASGMRAANGSMRPVDAVASGPIVVILAAHNRRLARSHGQIAQNVEIRIDFDRFSGRGSEVDNAMFAAPRPAPAAGRNDRPA